MKKIIIVSVMALFISSCGDVYKEERGMVFEGTWMLTESYEFPLGVRERVYNTNTMGGRFIKARNLEDEKFLLFYSKGTYDSSFFYRIQDSVLFVRKIIDTPDGIGLPQKPLNPKSEYSPEKCYGVFSFSERAALTMRIRRYALNAKGDLQKNILLGEDIYERPAED